MRGILAVDPSWRGLGWVLYCGEQVKFSGVSDIKIGTSKSFMKPLSTIGLVRTWLIDTLMPQIGHLAPLFDCIVIENQFRTNMKYLQYILVTALATAFPACTVHFVSALSCKRKYGIEYGKSHNQNKKNALKYVQDNAESLLAGSLHRDNDNIADAILLLNYRDSTIKTKHYSMPQRPESCPKCHQETVWLNTTKKPGPNLGREFYSCSNDDCKFFVWDDALGSNTLAEFHARSKPTTGKRTAPYPTPSRPKKLSRTDSHTIDPLLTEVQAIRKTVENIADMFQNWRCDPMPDPEVFGDEN